MIEYKGILNSSQFVIGVAVVATLATNFYFWFQNRKKTKIPENWICVGKISKLVLYPLKSAAGVDINSAVCTARGLREKSSNGDSSLMLDRSFMIFEEKSGNFLNGKKEKRILKINVRRRSGNSIILSAPEREEIEVQIPSVNGKQRKCIMFAGEQVNVIDCGDRVAEWLSKYFEREGSWRLGYYFSEEFANRKMSDKEWQKYTSVYDKLRKNDLGAFADIASYMILTEESVKELNGRLDPENHVTFRNFRPNILISGSEKPFAEDSWDWIKIGENVIMRQVKPCTRCIVITMNPFSGVYNKQREPLKTLNSFRQVDDLKQKEIEGNSPVFGQYFGIHQLGSISIGDTVYIGSN